MDIPQVIESQLYAWEARKGKSSFDAAEELASLKVVLARDDVSRALVDHRIDAFVAAGGSGLILRLIYEPHSSYRALKVPRAPLLNHSETPADIEDPEVEALGKLNHDHIPRLFASVALKPGRTLMLGEYIDDGKELVPFIDHLCQRAENDPSEEPARSVLTTLATLTLQIARALDYMHVRARLYHFDIKPGNILVSGIATNTPKAWIIDMGLAKDASKVSARTEINVNFTLKYAHPRLTSRDLKITRTQAKSGSTITAEELDARYDLFSLGRTIQECLKVIRSYFGQQAHRLYEFESLHMIACLCLDGEIRRTEPVADRDDAYDFVEDVANSCGASLFRKHKFALANDVVRALERILGLYSIEQDIPELDPWFPSTINASDISYANLTDRVRHLIVHPLFKRLERERQLGLLSEVFPTATHTRGNHSIGVYAAACQYIAALYHDHENPTCKILFKPDQIKVTLVASLLHDLGQTAFGHDIEELNEEVFSHAAFSRRLIELSRSTEDDSKISIHRILMDPEPQGWNLGPNATDTLLSFLESTSSEQPLPVLGLLRQIIDGPIDADKLDYIVRDSVDCRVQYGHGIDIDRFLRSLTAHWVDIEGAVGDDVGPLQLAIRAKGKASADAFILARTQLYQSVYWHHTFRAIKAMFLTAASMAIIHQEGQLDKSTPKARTTTAEGSPSKGGAAAKKFKNDFNEGLKDAYFFHVYGRPLGITPETAYVHADGTTLFGRFKESALEQFPGLPTDRTLDFFYQLGNDGAKQLLSDLVTRKFYKRVWEMPVSSLSKTNFDRVAKRLRDPETRISICDAIGQNLYTALSTAIGSHGTTTYIHNADAAFQRLKDSWQESGNLLADMPLRSIDSVIAAPEFVPDFRRKYFHTARRSRERTSSSAWRDDVGTMLKESAYLRLFVRPEVHALVLQYLDQSSLESALAPILK